jgi:hypothetical protein
MAALLLFPASIGFGVSLARLAAFSDEDGLAPVKAHAVLGVATVLALLLVASAVDMVNCWPAKGGSPRCQRSFRTRGHGTSPAQ